MWEIFLALYFLTQAILLILLILSWERIFIKSGELEGSSLPVSVIIPTRNEEENIEAILNDLGNQDYPKDQFEIIVVNDHSDDKTEDIVHRMQHHFHNLRIISLREAEGKKQAIDEGIRSAHYEIIVTTDADCRVGTQWLKSLTEFLAVDNYDMAFGLVSYGEVKSFVGKMISLEQSALIGSGAALWQIGAPIMANGANLCFKKIAYNEVNGYEGNFQVPSGDDIFLLTKFVKHGLKINCNPSGKALVITKGTIRGDEFIQQRKRWAGKWIRSGNRNLIATGIIVFLLNILWIFSLVVVMIGKFSLAYFLLGTLMKATLEFIFIQRINLHLGKKVPLPAFLVLELIYPFYAAFFGLVSNFGGYRWKGRKY